MATTSLSTSTLATTPTQPLFNNMQGTTYCGMRRFALRMAEHRNYAKSNNVAEPSGEHFNLAWHSFHHIQGLAVEQVRSKDPFILKAGHSPLHKQKCKTQGPRPIPVQEAHMTSKYMFA